jgi:signal transduction histidine kinase
MFRSARITLTAWYLLIVICLVVLFSCSLYEVVSSQLKQNFLEKQMMLIKKRATEEDLSPLEVKKLTTESLSPDAVIAVVEKFRWELVFIDLGIFVLAGMGSYFLAGRTLRPIELMMHEQSRFISDASHELLTPITALKAEIESVLREKQLSGDEARKILVSNLEEVEDLHILALSLLDLSSYQTKNVSMGEIVLTDLITKAVKKVNSLALQKQITLSLSVERGSLRGNEKSLLELLVILLDNAVKYSQPETVVTILGKFDKKEAAVQISDQGIGIPKSDIPFIFHRFYRVDASRTKQRIAGYGLGLSIAQQIVQLHKGKISVESTEGKGTTFTVLLPLA